MDYCGESIQEVTRALILQSRILPRTKSGQVAVTKACTTVCVRVCVCVCVVLSQLQAHSENFVHCDALCPSSARPALEARRVLNIGCSCNDMDPREGYWNKQQLFKRDLGHEKPWQSRKEAATSSKWFGVLIVSSVLNNSGSDN